MKAAIVREHGGPDVLTVVDDHPDPVATAGEVVLRVRACSLNHHDVFTRRGMPGIRIPLPVVIGCDIAGEIAAIGPGVTGWAPGDRVVLNPIFGKGMIGEVRDGGLAEYCAVPVETLIRIPDGVSFEAAAALPVAYGTAHRMMVRRGQVRAGEKVLVLGASGGVGTGCVQIARNAGAHVIAATSSPAKAARLMEIGAHEAIDLSSTDLVEEIRRRFGKPSRRDDTGGVDMAVNYTGGDSWVPTLKVLRRGGRMLTCGATAGFDPREDIRYIWTYELTIQGSNGWGNEDIVALLGMVDRGEIVPVIDAVLPLDQAREALALMEERRLFGKVVVVP